MAAPDLALDLSVRHFSRTLHGVTLIGTWMRNEKSQWRPCLVLLRAGDEKSDHAIPCVVTVDKAWIWSEDIGDPGEAARTAFSFVEALRLNTDPHNIFLIATLIHDHLGDLLTIPPRPADVGQPKEVVAEITVTDQVTGRTREAEITA